MEMAELRSENQEGSGTRKGVDHHEDARMAFLSDSGQEELLEFWRRGVRTQWRRCHEHPGRE